MKIALASDHAGFLLKEHIKKYLEEKGIKCGISEQMTKRPLIIPISL